MKTCSKCKETKPLDQFYHCKEAKDGRHSYCKPCNNTVTKEWQNGHRAQTREYLKNWRRANPEQRREIDRRRRRKRRLEVLSAYGNHCVCCGETIKVFLDIDHINNDGATHRQKIGSGSYGFYVWLKRYDYPEGFQILCRNCNWAKAKGGCPHNTQLIVKGPT